jgi:hypothetical protein
MVTAGPSATAVASGILVAINLPSDAIRREREDALREWEQTHQGPDAEVCFFQDTISDFGKATKEIGC